MTSRQHVVFAGAAMLLFYAHSASADLILSFDEPEYVVPTAGATTLVEVLLSSTATGPQVGPGNGLLSAAISLSFDMPAGIAGVLAPADISLGPLFGSSSSDVAGFTVTLAETSVAGVTDLSSPLLLGKFAFTGLAPGQTTITVSSLGPGPSFVTVGGDYLDPKTAATATIRVAPEPSSLAMIGAAALVLALFGCLRRHASTRWQRVDPTAG